MPIIPRSKPEVRMQNTAPVQIGSTNDARYGGEAISSFGEQISRFAIQQNQMDRQLRSEEFSSEALNSVKQAEVAAEQKSAPDGSDYDMIYQAEVQPRLNDAMNKYAGSDRKLQKEFSAYTNRIQNNQRTQNLVRQTQKLEEFNFGRLDGLGNSAANRVREAPTPDMVSAEMRSLNAGLDAMVTSGGLSSTNAAKVRQANNERIARAYIDGMSNKGQFGLALNQLRANQEDPNAFTNMTPAQAKDLGLIDSREMKDLESRGEAFKVPILTKGDKVKLSPEVATALNSLPLNVKAGLIDQMQAKARERTAIRMADINANLQGFKTLALTGADINEAQIAQMKKDVVSNPYSTPLAKRRLLDDINSTVVLNQTMKVAAATPRSQWGSLLSSASQKMQAAGEDAAKVDPRLKGMESDFAVQGNRIEAINRLQTALNQTKAQQDEDSANFMLANDPQIQTLYNGTKDGRGFEKYATTMLAKQNHLGISQDKQKLLTARETSSLVQTLQAVPDSYAMNDALATMENKYGKFFPQVMDELTKVDKSFANYRTISQIPAANRTPLIDALKNQPAIAKTFKEDTTLQGLVPQINTIVSSKMGEIENVLRGISEDSSTVESVNSIRNLVTLQAQRNIINDRTLSAENAVDKAYRTVFADNFQVIGAGSGDIMVPRQIGQYRVDKEGAKLIKTYVDTYSTPQHLVSDLNAYVPQGADADKFLSGSRWVTNDAQTGLMLVKPTAEGPAYVKDKYGNRIEKSYEEMFLKPGERVLEANKTSLQKFSDWLRK